MSDSLNELSRRIREFRDARNWEQFHTPKNLAAAIAIEAGELQERFLWKTDEQVGETIQDESKRQAIADEVADIAIFTILMAESLKINLADAIERKLSANAAKYPVDKAWGKATKYTEL